MSMACPGLPELSGSKWGERLLAPIEGQRYPLSGSIDLTERCNLNCVHCYINQPAGSRAAQAREMSTSQVLSVLDQMVEAGTLFLMLTGGEIFLRPDFPEIYRYAKKLGMILTLFTNATLVNESIADLLAASPPTIVEVSLYGATPEIYERVTGVSGSFKRCIRGIETLVDRGLNVMLKSVLLRENLHELEKMKNIATKYDARFRYDATVWPRLDGDTTPYAHRLSIGEQLALDRTDPERQQGWLEVAEKMTGAFIRSGYVYNCGAGYRSFHIDSAGNLTMCIMSRIPAYNLFEMPFAEAWNKLGVERQRKRRLGTACETCPLGPLCAQCPGWSLVVHGDLETPVAFICELAKQRAEQLCDYGKIEVSEEIISYE